MRVAVIGAGAAGLVALRHLVARPHFTAVGYEMTSRVGGTWVYTEDTGTDQYGLPIQSSMYKYLRTNLPKEIMAFPDFPFPKGETSFVKHEEVLQYLEDYAIHFGIMEHIKFNALVNKVIPLISPSGTRWQVQVKNLSESSEITLEEFDAVIVGNGHYAVPLIPDIAGLREGVFKGQVVHSHEYRQPESFQDKTVLCLGAGQSGQDIALEMTPYARQVYLAHRREFLTSPLPENLRQVCNVKRMLERSVVLEDDTVLDVDVLVLCTGYCYSFPFLDGCGVSVEDERVYPLYKHLIHAEHPTLAIVGLCKVIVPFPQFHCQVQFALAAWEGTMKLPSQEAMKADIEKDYQDRLNMGFPNRYAHHMSSKQWQYNDELAAMAKFKPLPPVLEKIYNFVHDLRVQNLPAYKKLNLELINDEEFKVLYTPTNC